MSAPTTTARRAPDRLDPPRVVHVAPGSPAERVGLQPGDEILAVAGEAPRDVVRYRLLADGPDVELAVRRGGLEHTIVVHKRDGEPLGAEVHSAVFDEIVTCDNHCPFCFIHQLPKGMRRSLSLKDDDYRLSFLYGNFTTLTRFTEADLERVVTEGLSPLHVSIHATDPEVRAALLRNRRGATSLRWLRALLDHGVTVHGQVVVCPGVNDGDVLDDTLLGVLDRFPELASVGVVPLGVSAHNREPSMRPHTRAEAVDVCARVDVWQQRFLRAQGRRLAWVSDEYLLMAGRDVPDLDHYEGVPQHENGVGMVATLRHEVRAALAGEVVAGTGPGEGFFSWVDAGGGCGPVAVPTGRHEEVDGAPAEGYRAERVAGGVPVALGRPGRRDRPVTLLTGEFGAAALAPLAAEMAEAAGVPVEVRAVSNRFFGGTIAVTGLLTGADLARELAGAPTDRRYLLPDVVLSRGAFLDGTTPADLPVPVEIVRTDGVALVEALVPGTPGRERTMSRRRAGHAQTWYDQSNPDELPLVAIVGRPNVGKSTLVNRLVGRRDAIVEERPGVTHDRKYFEVEWLGRRFRAVDTGGWLDTEEALDRQVSRQAELAVAEADVVVLVGDVTVGVTEEDATVADLLRRSGKPVLVVANKADHPDRDVDAWSLARLGLGDPIPISAMHGRSADVLLDAVLELLPPEPEPPDPEADDALLGTAGVADDSGAPLDVELDGGAVGDDADDATPADVVADGARPFTVALVGRPNVGKSTLFNRLVGDERSIVHDMAGTTRDTIDTIVETDDGVLRFVDTAGIRRRSRIDDGIEWFSLVRALQAVDAADATLLVIDATEGVTHQDQRLAERIDGAGCAVVIVLNKWDLVPTDDREDVVEDVGEKLSFLAYAPILRVSTLTGRGALRIMPALRQARAEYRRRVPTAKLNEVLTAAQRRHPAPPGDGGRRPKVKYATQGATDPPTFTLFASQSLPAPYLRYLERSIREAFSFGPTPIKLRVRRRD